MKRTVWYLLVICIFSIAITPVFAQDTVDATNDTLGNYPEANVTALVPNDSVLYDRIYRKVDSPLTIYDAPGGNVTNDYGVGYNFVTLNGQPQGDWTEIGANQWVSSAGLTEDVTISRFAGVLLPEDGLEYPLAWTLRHLRPSETAGGEQSDNNPYMYRYTRVSIYETVVVDGYNWYLVGENQWIHQFNVARILPIERPVDVITEKWVSVDLYEQVLIAYEGDTPVFSTMIS